MDEVKWGPWIKHDGGACPVVGEKVQVEFSDGDIMTGTNDGDGDWHHDAGAYNIMRYRVEVK